MRRIVEDKDVTFRIQDNRTVADVRGGEVFIDQQVELATERSMAEKKWEASKQALRSLSVEVQEIAVKKDVPLDRVNFLGSQEQIIEVSYSKKRKALKPDAITLAKIHNLTTLIQENVTVTLTGELARWALKALGDRSGTDPDFELSRSYTLADDFEDQKRVARQQGGNVAVLDKLNEQGVYVASVEAKLRR